MRWMKSAVVSGLSALLLSIPALASDRAALVQVVNKAAVQQTVSATPVSLNVGNPIQLTTAVTGVHGGATPTGTVVFSLTALGGTTAAVSSGPLALQADGTAGWTTANAPVGQYIASAAYAGDGQYQPSAASDATQIVVMGPVDFSLDIPKTLTIKQGATGTLTIGVASINAFQGDVGLSCSGLGTGMGCNFLPGTVHVAPSPTTAAAGGSSAVTSALAVSSTATTVETLGSSLLFLGLLAGHKKRRWMRMLSLVVLTVLGFVGLGVIGCGAPMRYEQKNGTPLGTYKVVVTGTSGTLVHSQTVTVTVN